MLNIIRELPEANIKDGVAYYNGYRIFLNTKDRIVVVNSYGYLNNHIDFNKEDIHSVIEYVKKGNEYKALCEYEFLNVNSIQECCDIINKFTFISARLAVTVYYNKEPPKRFSRVIDAHIWDDVLTLYNCADFSRDYSIKDITSLIIEYHKFEERKKLTINLI